jgi:hypothetical protein
VGDPLVYRLVRDGRRVIRLGLDPELPELPLLSGNEHLRNVRDPEERDVPEPHAPEIELCGYVLRREVGPLLEPFSGEELSAKESVLTLSGLVAART